MVYYVDGIDAVAQEIIHRFRVEVMEQHRNNITSYLTGSIKYISNPFLSSVFDMLTCPKTHSVRFRH